MAGRGADVCTMYPVGSPPGGFTRMGYYWAWGDALRRVFPRKAGRLGMSAASVSLGRSVDMYMVSAGGGVACVISVQYLHGKWVVRCRCAWCGSVGLLQAPSGEGGAFSVLMYGTLPAALSSRRVPFSRAWVVEDGSNQAGEQCGRLIRDVGRCVRPANWIWSAPI